MHCIVWSPWSGLGCEQREFNKRQLYFWLSNYYEKSKGSGDSVPIKQKINDGKLKKMFVYSRIFFVVKL